MTEGPQIDGAPLRPFLRIVRDPYEEPHVVNLIVSASNGRQRGELEVYANASDLATIARNLNGFPWQEGDTFSWELGSEDPEDRWAFYFRLRFWQLDPRGECGVELRFNNNALPPDREITEFSLQAHPADLDRLAALLREFSKLEHRVLEWTITDGDVRDAS